MLKKLKNIIFPIVISIVVFLVVTILTFFNLNFLGNLFKVKNLGVKTVEWVIDNNQNFWSEYRDQHISFKLPMYLFPFNDISATNLTTEEELVANYRRHSDSEYGDNYSGRSYSIILMQKDPYFNTQTVDVKTWIMDNKMNIENRNCSTCSDHTEIPIEEVTLGGQKAYSVSKNDQDYNTPRYQAIYFKTPNGIASITFFSHTPSALLIKDYKVFEEIVQSFTFLK